MISNVNLNQLRIFEVVYRTRSMTEAAKELHLTQSGVSQHIQSLEESLGLKLFDRIQRKILPTSIAARLYEKCHVTFEDLGKALTELTGTPGELSGTVSLGTPIEFGNNVLMRTLAEFCHQHPKVNLRLQYDFANVMNRDLMSGALDLAFVDDYPMDPAIQTLNVYSEELHLCASIDYLKEKKLQGTKESRDLFDSMEYVDFQEATPLLRIWFAHHFPRIHFEHRLRVSVMDVQGLSRLIVKGVGAGVLPDHLISRIDPNGKLLVTFRGSGKPVKNLIRLAYVEKRTLSAAAKALLERLKKIDG